jgi:hypothetical protein
MDTRNTSRRKIQASLRQKKGAPNTLLRSLLFSLGEERKESNKKNEDDRRNQRTRQGVCKGRRRNKVHSQTPDHHSLKNKFNHGAQPEEEEEKKECSADTQINMSALHKNLLISLCPMTKTP